MSGSQTGFYSIQTIFTFPPAMHEVSNFSISLLILVIICHFDFCHPSGNEVLSHCNFYLCLLTANDVEHLFIVFLFQKKLFKLLDYLKFGFFLLSSFKFLFYVLYTGPLSDIWFTNIFYQSVVLLFAFLTRILSRVIL